MLTLAYPIFAVVERTYQRVFLGLSEKKLQNVARNLGISRELYVYAGDVNLETFPVAPEGLQDLDIVTAA